MKCWNETRYSTVQNCISILYFYFISVQREILYFLLLYIYLKAIVTSNTTSSILQIKILRKQVMTILIKSWYMINCCKQIKLLNSILSS